MRKTILCFLCGLCLSCFAGSAVAAPALTGPLCIVTGIVENTAERNVKYEPESWRLSWQLPEYRVYTDVTVNLSSAGDCDAAQFESKPFQLRGDADQSLLTKGACIRAKTQYSGDEFALGQWLFDIEILDATTCNEPQ